MSPVFFQNVHAMNPNLVALDTTDQETTLSPPNRWSFAAAETVTPVVLAEAEALAQEYVLLFSKEPQGPSSLVALLGLAGRNAYVDAAGQWQARTIPARLRLYPFMLAAGQTPSQYVVARDADAPHFQGEAGQPLFDGQGQPTPLVQQVTAALIEQQRSQLEAQALTQQLEVAGLIDERRIDVQLKDGTWRSYAGFKAVVEERLAALDEATRTELQQSGALKLLELHRKSLAHFGRLIA